MVCSVLEAPNNFGQSYEGFQTLACDCFIHRDHFILLYRNLRLFGRQVSISLNKVSIRENRL